MRSPDGNPTGPPAVSLASPPATGQLPRLTTDPMRNPDSVLKSPPIVAPGALLRHGTELGPEALIDAPKSGPSVNIMAAMPDTLQRLDTDPTRSPDGVIIDPDQRSESATSSVHTDSEAPDPPKHKSTPA